jgi:hypothetical protein
MSVLGREGTLALQQTASLFDGLVGRHVIDLDAGQLIFDRNHELDTVKSIGAETVQYTVIENRVVLVDPTNMSVVDIINQ